MMLSNLFFLLGGMIFGGILVNYFQRKQLEQISNMIKSPNQQDPADWWKET